MKQHFTKIIIKTNKQKLINITDELESIVRSSEISDGLLTVFIKHTSASLIIQENADGDVLRDIENFFNKLVPMDTSYYAHNTEGSDDMPAHIKSLLTSTHLSIPLQKNELLLGTWQGIFLFEHRIESHKRTIEIHIMGK
ncbi:MAG: hypothetical protein CMD82_00215 [Gammaproteobacteria bacterium]|nr:hypothetical protein [Gammaproteobacteria bacterium]|tara:strand:+ start:2819 stop:3238 length:420 start_codon:yes stop_codon:yes gene_type:complete